MNYNLNYEKKVAILKGGSSSEREVSLSTGELVQKPYPSWAIM